MLFLVAAAGIALGSLSALAVGQSPTVYQHGRAFSAPAVTITKGMPVTFVNDDTVPHNIASLSAGNEFDLGSQPPGTSTDVTFTTIGEVQVICAIHPRMKMTVVVTN